MTKEPPRKDMVSIAAALSWILYRDRAYTSQIDALDRFAGEAAAMAELGKRASESAIRKAASQMDAFISSGKVAAWGARSPRGKRQRIT